MKIHNCEIIPCPSIYQWKKWCTGRMDTNDSLGLSISIWCPFILQSSSDDISWRLTSLVSHLRVSSLSSTSRPLVLMKKTKNKNLVALFIMNYNKNSVKNLSHLCLKIYKPILDRVAEWNLRRLKSSHFIKIAGEILQTIWSTREFLRRNFQC